MYDAVGEEARLVQLRNTVADTIRLSIVSGEAAPGTLLRQRAIAERTGTSITPVREALFLLAQEGWVRQEPNRGFRVTPPRRSDFDALNDAKKYLYGELARQAALRCTPATLNHLRELDVVMMGPRSSAKDVCDANNRLHMVINEAADCPRLARAADVTRFLPASRFFERIDGYVEENRKGHGAILDALERHDADSAASLMREHNRRNNDHLVAYLETIGFFEMPAAAEDPAHDARPYVAPGVA